MEEKKFQALENITVESDSLYREEVFTDLRLATIRKLNPVKSDGSADPERDAIFIGETQLVSSLGPLPLSSRLEVSNLSEAAAAFPEAIQKAAQKMVEDINELRRREASKIVVPGQDAAAGLTGLGPNPGAPGNIRLT